MILVSGAAAGSVPQQDQVWAVSLSGDQPRVLFDNAELATFSPDGQRVVFTRGRQTQLWVADANGQNARRLQPEDSGEAFLWVLWSPDGKRIVTDRSRDIQPSAEEAKAAKNNPVDQLQIEHKWIYQSYDAENGKLLASAPGLHFDSAVLLRSGELFFPTNTRDSGLSLSRVMTDPDTGAILDTPTILQPGASIWGANGYAAASLSASADGHHFSAILDRHATDVYVADLHWSENTPSLEHVTRLTHHTSTSYPTNWSPSGDVLLFDNGYAGTSVVARQRVGTDKLEVVIDTKTSAVGHYTPDGRWILFLQYVGDPARLQAIGRIPAQGGTPQMLSVPGELESFNCSNSSSGSCVLREREGKSQLVFYDLDPLHGRGVELARIPWKPTVFGDWKLSSDGRTVAMADHDPVHPGIELLSLRAAGHAAATHELTDLPLPGFGSVLEPVWAAEGRSFFIETHTAEGFDLVYRDPAGHTTLLRQSPDSIWPVLSRDGKKIAFPGRTPLNRNVWIGTR
ncbi:WD40-like Beta Propeller Repeat [Bryocella elongata]|uniref:WD40-like Beta Propeller Repeat n=1 Tax=Bryocella elongata TaxID=863522 RepID=A0A1H5UV20_9BACT|nr:PD40 domain-containing protein [Bryocella elongata]SEF78915.1 WD40-like Beta Propeller Repeat [Bryocella elongata]